MLVRFTFENWRSFRDASILNLVATDEEEHGKRVPEIQDYGFRLLPTVAIYGGNASGKSNLFKALQFSQRMITQGVGVRNGIPVEPFRLDAKYVNRLRPNKSDKHKHNPRKNNGKTKKIV